MELIETLKIVGFFVLILVFGYYIVGFYVFRSGLINSDRKIAEIEASNTRHMIKRIQQGVQIEDLRIELKQAENSTKRKSLRKEIARLKGLNTGLETTISNVNSQRMKLIDIFNKTENEYKDRIQHLTETIEKRKHQSKQNEVNSELWKSITDKYNHFSKGDVFCTGKRIPSDPMFLILTDNQRTDWMVDKSHFKPVKV
ncbi:MAG TPA: hypothetical protein VIK55_06750 [Paludibacter sp.]